MFVESLLIILVFALAAVVLGFLPNLFLGFVVALTTYLVIGACSALALSRIGKVRDWKILFSELYLWPVTLWVIVRGDN